MAKQNPAYSLSYVVFYCVMGYTNKPVMVSGASRAVSNHPALIGVIMMSLRSMLWLTPFACFIAGYYAISWLMGSETIQAPQLAGKRLNDVVAELAPYHLNLRILEEVEEPAMPEGTVLEQRPAPGQRIKIYQSIGVVVSRKQRPVLAPRLLGEQEAEVQKRAASAGVRVKAYALEGIYPLNQCIGQVPLEGFEVSDKTVIAYVSTGQTPVRLVPDFRGRSLAEVVPFLQSYGIPSTIFPQEYASHKQCPSCVVVAHKPVAGSFIDLGRLPVVQLQVEHKSLAL